ncbi:hypothetical protein [Neobacillus sp. LXY-4]|uniref:hypothetical protein n=1 Tax=Neobacillus sp. LXY-4 TaxID=3379826 RepID=UPI003EDFE0FF
MVNKVIDQGDVLSNLIKFKNRWIEIGLPNGHFYKFYFTDINPLYIGGYLSRGEYKNLYSDIYPNGSVSPINRWVSLSFHKSLVLSFFLTHISENFIGGYLPRNMIQSVKLSIIQDQLFFEEYDLRFLPSLVGLNPKIPIEEKEKRIQVVKRAERVLFERLKTRNRAAKVGRIPNFNEMPSLNVDDIIYLSNKQLELYYEFFLDGKGHLDFKRIQTCFELFANGQIQGNKYPGNLQPNSAGDFLFAEFALQAIEYNVNSEIWSELLKTFVKTQEIFIKVYRPNGIMNPKLSDYKYYNFKYYKQVSEKKKARLRNKYDSMTKNELEQEYGKNLMKAQSNNSLI